MRTLNVLCKARWGELSERCKLLYEKEGPKEAGNWGNREREREIEFVLFGASGIGTITGSLIQLPSSLLGLANQSLGLQIQQQARFNGNNLYQ